MLPYSERFLELGRQINATTDEKEIERLKEERNKEVERIFEEWRKDPFMSTFCLP